MIWLQENWIIALIVAVLAVLVISFLLRRPKADKFDLDLDDAPTAEPSKTAPPPKPLEPKKPEIIAAEPAKFKPLNPVTPPAPKPVAVPTPALAPTPAAQPVAPPPAAAASPEPTPAAPAPEVPAPTDQAPAPAEAAPASAADNLRLIKGLGPKLATLLASLGITRFEQIAAWTDADIARIDPQLGAFQGRIVRDNWVDQASYLARRDKEGFEAKYGALGGEL